MNSQNKRSIFVTGAGGFIGANLVRKLLKLNADVHILNRTKNTSWRLKEILNLVTIHIGDITDFTSLKNALIKSYPSYIIHLATYGAYPFQAEIDKIVSVNVEGTKNLLEASKDIPYKSFINTSSSSEYGIKSKPMREDNFCNPVSCYGATKLATTHMCKVFAQLNNKPIVTFRLFSVYGPYEEPTRFFPTVIKALIEKKTIKLTPGNQRRDFIYVDDVTNAYLKAMQIGSKMQGEILNIGTGKEYTNDEVIDKLFQVTNEKTQIEKGAFPKRMWDAQHWRANNSRAKKLLAWNPDYNLNKGLETTYWWFKKNINFYH